MSLCRTFRAFTSLVADALEALIYPSPFDDIADELWAESSSPAHGSAGDEPSGGSVPPPDVEPPLGFQGLSARDLRGAAYAVGIYAERYSQVATNTAWVGLAERLKSAADAM